MTLSKKQIKHLKQLAHHHKAIFQIGKQGLSEAFMDQVDQALEKRELIKFTILQNSDEEIRDAAETIAEEVMATVVQVIGHTGVLYRPSSNVKYQRISTELKGIK